MNKLTPIQTELSRYFNFSFYDERHGYPNETNEHSFYTYINTYSSYYAIVESILDDIKNNNTNSDNLINFMNMIKQDDDHDICQEIIAYLQNITYAQSIKLKSNQIN